ncbi:SAV_915 family protein [Streptomyces tendae]|uniref:SAV_915 family protein n=1 Tax=Streptomyces tendae TaxID=1932 RepID=UPI000FD94A56|nr:SAV_915 family protein [Streptomyces sp. S10(2018)]
MTEPLYDEDPEPSERFPAGLLYVPFRPGPCGHTTLRLFRTPLGRRTAVGFTSRRRLVTTLGTEQAWIRLAMPALRALAEPLGVTTLTVDPQFTAPAAAPERARAAAPAAPDRAASAAPAPASALRVG